MGSGPLRKKPGAHEVEPSPRTSGYPDSKPSGPDSSRVVTGLPLREPSTQPPPDRSAAVKGMAGKDDVFQDASHIFVVLGASVSLFSHWDVLKLVVCHLANGAKCSTLAIFVRAVSC